MEAVLIESMREKGLQVERCTEPSSMATSMSAVDQKDPHAYVVKVRWPTEDNVAMAYIL